MGKFEIDILGAATGIKYTREDGRTIVLYCDLWGGGEESYILKDIKHWEAPYEDEEMSIEIKQEILKDIEMYFKNPYWDKWIINVDLSPESNIVHYDEIASILKRNSNTKEMGIGRRRDFKEMHIEFTTSFFDEIAYLFFEYCKLPNKEREKFKEEISNNKNIQWVLLEFAKWKVNEDRENINQKKFNYGLYALEMVLVEENKEEVKEILMKYVIISKEKGLLFEEFMKRNRELNEVIKEVRK